MEREVICRVNAIRKSFSAKLIIADVTFDIHEGEIIGIIGKSGSGKSTLLQIIGGLSKADAGSITFTRKAGKHGDLKELIGYSFQPYSLYDELSAKANLDYFGSLYGYTKQEVQQRLIPLLQMTDLAQPDLSLMVNELSGGMRKRLDIVCALLHNPKVLLLDEPTAGLDPLRRKDILRIINKIRAEGVTVILTSHIMSDIDGICDRVLILHDGKKLIIDAPENVKDELIENELIKLRTLPGDYQPVIDKLQGFNIVHCEQQGGWLHIYTPESEILIHYLLHLLEQQDETIDKLIVLEPDLGDVFERLASKQEPMIMKEHIEHLKAFVYQLIGKRYPEQKIIEILMSHHWPKEVCDAVVNREVRILRENR